MNAQRKVMSRKPKVPPVIGSKVKIEKMLKRQMNSLSLATTKATMAKKINMDDSSSGEDDDEAADADEAAQTDEAMSTTENAALLVPKISYQKSRISKQKPGLTRAQEISLKKEIKRRLKFGTKDGRKDAKKLRM